MRRTQSLPVYFPAVRMNSMAWSKSTIWSSPAVLYSALVLVLWFFGDAVLGVSLHLLHIVIEILELGLEPGQSHEAMPDYRLTGEGLF